MDLEFMGDRIAKLRIAKDVSAREMSLSIGQCAAYINNIENKNNMPSMQGLYYICDYFKLTPKEFFDEGTAYPTLILELVSECEKLDEKSLQKLLEFIKTLRQ
ncbi:MAG: helix-turn-helix domain-containing protein [Clostridiales bacterium]|nr:helix-turn-helix domain-containing protein [Clostridiales bacterium]